MLRHGTGQPELEAEARKLRRQGMTFASIASKLDIGKATAHEYCADDETRERYNAQRRRRQQVASQTLDRLTALEAAIRDEIDRLRKKGKRNAALIHFKQADRLEEILGESKGGEKR